MEYKRLTDDELADFLQRACVQLVPELTQQLLSLGTELAEYRTKIEQGTLIEQKNGKWINLPDYGGGGWKMVGSDEAVQPKHCSICGDVYVKEYKYCPSCGAKMKD